MHISNETLNQFCDFFSQHMGMYFPLEKRKEAIPKIQKIINLLGFKDPDECLKSLVKVPLGKNHMAVLVKELTIGETYFFRNPTNFLVLKNTVLPWVIREKKQKRSIKIWSAGCCTGEEIYSVAIALHQILPDIKDWNITLLGTDINHAFIEKAREGYYKQWSFRTTPDLIKRHYFLYDPQRKQYELKREIKAMASFDYLNLITDHYPSVHKKIFEMDLILCSHVLIYFSRPHIKQVIQHLAQSLNENGLLIVSDVEVPLVQCKEITSQKLENSQVFARKILNPIATLLIPKSPLSSKKENKENVQQLKEWYQEKKYSQIITLLEEQLIKEESKEHSLKNLTDEIILLTKSCANEGNFPKALIWCEKGLDLNKVNPVQHYLHGMILQELGRSDEAVISLKRAIFLDPSLAIAHLSLAILLVQKREEKEANRCLRNVFKLLKQYNPEEILPGTDDLTAERLKKIAESINSNEKVQRTNS